MKVCHVSSAHARYDIRIFKKMCVSIAANGYDTNFVVADGQGDELIDGVQIHDAGAKEGGRISRMTKVVNKVLRKALEVKADLYHLHDPELMFVGLVLKSKGYKVVFDAHEDLPKQLKSKPYLNKTFRFLLPKVFGFLESVCFRYYDGLIGATSTITQKLASINKQAETINNYPILGELNSSQNSQRNNDVCYLGGITEIRGIHQMLDSLAYLDNSKLKLAGGFSPQSLYDKAKANKNWEKVEELGMIDRKQAADLLSTSLAGLVLFHAVPNHIEAQPNKLFEYMSAGLPVISSNFDMWKDIIEVNHCGLCVDPMDPKAIADAISFLSNNPEEAQKMGENGLNAVVNVYNWAKEESKLLSFYSEIAKK